MIVVVLVCVVVILGLVFALLRLRSRVDELTDVVRDTITERDQARSAADAAAAAAQVAVLERDDAMDRVSRSRRDAAEVANRLSDEVAARSCVEQERDELLADLAAARSAGPAGTTDTLWALALRQSEHRWRLSVAVDPDAPSPIAGAPDPFRAAVEIEVDAAREESGADVEVVWKGAEAPSPEQSVVALALVRDLIDVLGTTTASTEITVECAGGAVDLEVRATDEAGVEIPIPIPAAVQVEPGRARIA